jgi:Ca-activated chloride channel family protein
MQFATDTYLWLIAAAVLALALMGGTALWRHRQIARFRRDGIGHGIGHAHPDPLRSHSRLRGLVTILLMTGALALLGLSVARPQFGKRTTEIRQEGVAVAVALDVSLSMAAQDVAPNRLTVATAQIADLLDRLRGDRVGLVIFSGDAFIRFPLTRDTNAARDVIADLDPAESLVRTGSNIAAAIDAARLVLDPSDAAANVIIIISDGESLQGDARLAARAAADDGLRIFTALVGTEAGASIPVIDLGSGDTIRKIDSRTGAPVITRADPQALQALADIGRGRLIRLDNPGALSGLAADLDSLESTAFTVRTDSVPIERYQIFAGIALALLLIEPLIPSAPLRRARRRLRRPHPSRRTVLTALVGGIGLIAAACASTAFDRNADGNRLADAGRYDDALQAYRDAQLDAPDDVRINLNVARVLHATEAYERAVAESARAIGDTDALSARALYQIGAHRFAQDDLIAARNAYIEALLIDPTDLDTKYNLELVNLALFGGQPDAQPNPESDAQQAPPGDPNGQPPAGDAPPGPGQPNPSDDDIFDQDADPTGQPVVPAQPVDPSSTPDGLSQDDIAAQAGQDLQSALDQLNRDDPTLEQALAILDALRARQARERFGSGATPIPIAGQDDY